MPREEKMPINARYAKLPREQKQYFRLMRSESSQLLDHMEQITGVNRKTLTGHVSSKIERTPRSRHRVSD